MSSSQSLLDFWDVITESKRIINAHSRHFLALSLLFLLPLSFSLTVFPILLPTFNSADPNRIISLLRLTIHRHDQSTLTLFVIFSSIILLLALAAVSSITRSVVHGFHGRPVKLISAIKSIFTYFPPLLVTFIATQIVIFSIFTFFGFVIYTGIKSFELIVGELSYESPYFIAISVTGLILLGLVLIFVSVNWYLVNVIVVVESRWGFYPLIRSWGLVRGMRWVAMSLIMYFVFLTSLVLWIGMASGDADEGSVNDGWKNWAFIIRIAGTCVGLTLIMRHSIAASTVMYMYCKALHGELAGEIAKEFAAEYVSFPFDDDEKVHHVVLYVQ